MSGYEKMVLIVLLAYKMDKEYCYPSRQLIADNAGFDVKTVDKALRNLVKHKLVIIEKEGRVNKYFFHSSLKIKKKPF